MRKINKSNILKASIIMSTLFLFGIDVNIVSAEVSEKSLTDSASEELVVEKELLVEPTDTELETSEETVNEGVSLEAAIDEDEEHLSDVVSEEQSEQIEQEPVHTDSEEDIETETEFEPETIQEPTTEGKGLYELPITAETDDQSETDIVNDLEEQSIEIERNLIKEDELSADAEKEELITDTEIEEVPEAELEEVSEAEIEEISEAEFEGISLMMATASVETLKTSSNNPWEIAEVNRIYGDNRYKNAVAISQTGWKSSSKVILANGEKFADSLTGSPLASLYNAPILLTKANAIPSEVLAEIKRLNPSEVIILGGQVSVSDSISKLLVNNGYKTRRIGGRTRYDVAENIANEIMAVEGKNRDAFLTSGELFSDALSIAPVASSKRLPIFLTRGNVLHQTVVNAIPNVNRWTIIGGAVTISEAVEKKMNNLGANTRRIAGRNRYEVNRNVVDFYGATGDKVYVTSGEHFSDALPASVLAAKEGNTLLLVKNNNKTTIKEQKQFSQKRHNFKKFTFIGGPRTLSKETENEFSKIRHLVYLDPGHGGTDSGAIGRVNGRQYEEADLNLSVSLKVKNLLESRGYDVVMSRTADTTIGLYDRPFEANYIGADILVSVHHNAMPNNNTVAGIETFYYKPDNNYPPLPENRPYHNNSKRISDSRNLANLVQNELIKQTGARNRGVKTGAFALVREARMPAVLLELGYVTTTSELNKLIQNSYQNQLASSIANGIQFYFI